MRKKMIGATLLILTTPLVVAGLIAHIVHAAVCAGWNFGNDMGEWLDRKEGE